MTVAGTSHKYVANSALSGGSFTIGRPGLLAAEADNDAITIGNDYTANLAFERSAVVGIMRPPAIPDNPIMSQMPISDGKGMTYLFVEIVGDGMITWRLHLAYGFKVVQGEHVAVVLG